ncbi:MAG: four helix bundle protein [Niabella sp.]
MRDDTDNLIVTKSFNFSLKIIEFAEKIFSTKKFSLANQVFRSGTSIGANIREAQNAESKDDFIHKMKIACKEADELEYWLLLCSQSEYLPNPDEALLTELKSIIKILSKIVSTSKKS